MQITLETAKSYLRVDSDDENQLITSMLESAKQICADVLRGDLVVFPENLPIVEIAVLYTLGYLYEHREEANHHELNETLRNLLQGMRSSKF